MALVEGIGAGVELDGFAQYLFNKAVALSHEIGQVRQRLEYRESNGPKIPVWSGSKSTTSDNHNRSSQICTAWCWMSTPYRQWPK